MQKLITCHRTRFLVVGAGWLHNEDHGLHGLNEITERLKQLNEKEASDLHIQLRKIDAFGGRYPAVAAQIIRAVHYDLTKDYLDRSLAGVFHIGAM